MAYRTPIAKVRGLGSARSGLQHWKMQRLTAVSNVLLVLWFVFSAMALSGSDYAQVRAWLASPVTASLMVLLVISTFYHARLGLQVVVEDYVHGHATQLLLQVAIRFLCFLGAAAGVLAVIRIALGH